MLQRLAAMGVVTDAATSDDFSRVRALPAWADFEASTSGKPVTEKSVAATKPAAANPDTLAKPDALPKPSAPPKPDPPNTAGAKPDNPKPDTAKSDVPKSEIPKSETSKPAAAKPEPTTPTEPAIDPKAKTAGRTPAPLLFPAAGLTATGLGYDAVSGRFIIGDGKDRRLLVIGERSARLASLAGADAGFDEVSAFEIDAVEGDLWVVSTSTGSRSSTLHKLQLISGRVLTSIQLPPDEGPSRFTDVAVTPQSILVLDGEGRRVAPCRQEGADVGGGRAPGGAGLLEPGAGSRRGCLRLYDRGIVRIDLATRATTVVEPAPKAPLEGTRWMRWHRGSLVAIQGEASGPFRLVRIRLDESGRRARTVEVIGDNVVLAGPTSATIAGNVIYYLSSAAADQIEIKKLTLK